MTDCTAPEPDEERCSGCGKLPAGCGPVAWSPAFAASLCQGCRAQRTDGELRETERVSTAVQAATRLKGRRYSWGGS